MLIPTTSVSLTLSSWVSSLSVQFSHSVMSDFATPWTEHTRLPCPPPALGAYSNSCPSGRWCHPTISSSRPLLLLPSIFPCVRVFSNESVLCIRWPKYWSFSFSISPSNKYSGLVSSICWNNYWTFPYWCLVNTSILSSLDWLNS